jgi:hypothetical protein
MGPFFVFIRWGMDITVYDFATLMEARAFYYGMRELQRRVREYERTNSGNSRVNALRALYFGGKTMVWITCIMNDVMDENGIGHFTIYQEFRTYKDVKAELDYFLDTADI